MRQTKKRLEKKKPEHSLMEPRKQIKSSDQKLPCSQEKSKSEGISDPRPSLKSSNQESPSSQEKLISANTDQNAQNKEEKQQKLVPIFQIVNKNFIYLPNNQTEYGHLIQMAATLYDFNLENSQWISPQIIRYCPLFLWGYVFLGTKQFPEPEYEAQIYLQKSEKMNKKLKQVLECITYSYFDRVYCFRGPPGVGKSYTLIQWVLENRKRDDIRILHILLDDHYLQQSSLYFAHDFIYCFYKDLENEDFPDPPPCKYQNLNCDKNIPKKKGEKWYDYIFWKLDDEKNTNFLNLIFEKYLQKKGIAFILLWDEDKIFQTNEKTPLLMKLIRDYGKFNLKLITASNSNKIFKELKETEEVIEQNVGFSKEESKKYLDNTLEKMYGKEFKLENKLFEELYQLTNGNGYYLSQFVYNETVTNNYQEKIICFTNAMKMKLEGQISKFFFERHTYCKYLWLEEFPQLLFYLDCDRKFNEQLKSNVDRNVTYLEDFKLKSVNPLAREIFVKYYQEKIKEWNQCSYFLALLKKEEHFDNNPIVKEILYERYVIQEFLQKDEYEYILPEEEEMKKEKSQKKIKDEELIDYISKDRYFLIKPVKFSNPAFDFIIWNKNKEEANIKYLYVFKFTINENHNQSDKAFFTEEKYKFLRELKDVRIRFIWITNNPNFRSKYEGKEIGYINIMF